MGYFQVRYNSRVVIYDRRGFIRLATGLSYFEVNYTIITIFLEIYSHNFAVITNP